MIVNGDPLPQKCHQCSPVVSHGFLCVLCGKSFFLLALSIAESGEIDRAYSSFHRRINSEAGQWPCPITICVAQRCKRQSWKDLQARHQQIRNQLSAGQARIISPGENRRDLGHVPQLFHPGSCGTGLLPSGECVAVALACADSRSVAGTLKTGDKRDVLFFRLKTKLLGAAPLRRKRASDLPVQSKDGILGFTGWSRHLCLR